MFYTSFLIKEGKAKIFFKEMDENDKHLPYIIPVKKRKQNEGASIRLDDKHQLLMSISVEEWIRLKVVLIVVLISRIENLQQIPQTFYDTKYIILFLFHADYFRKLSRKVRPWSIIRGLNQKTNKCDSLRCITAPEQGNTIRGY